MNPRHDIGWPDEQICARAAAEVGFAETAYLGAGLSRGICDYVAANREATFYFGDGLLDCAGPITKAAFVPQAVQFNGGRIDVVFLAASDAGEQSAQRAQRAASLLPSLRRGHTGNADSAGLPRAVVLVPDIAKASEAGLLHRLSRYTLDTPARPSVRIICTLGVFDTTIAGLSVIELAHGVRVEEVRSLLRISPRYSASRTTANIASYVQC